MESNKKYWKGLEELQKTPEFVENNKGEFSESLPIEEVLNDAGLKTVTPRRDFLKALGFGVGAVTLAACQKAPVHKSIPYLIKPEEVTPGVANYYASSFNGVGVLVKTREGRPIKIEGNPACLLGEGRLDAVGQASILDLYDVSKLKGPKLKGENVGWQEVDSFVRGELNKIQAGGKKIRIVSSTINSPSGKAVIADFIAQYPNTRHIQYDAVSYSGIIQANQSSFGRAVIPHYHFERADVIVSFGADFLGSWISPLEFNRQYIRKRNIASLKNKKMSRHIQIESGMTTTGTNADVRIAVKPSEEALVLLNLYSALGGAAQTQKLSNPKAEKALTLVAKELTAARGRALVVSGSNDVNVQIVVNAINSLIGSYGTTIDINNPSYQYAGNDADFMTLLGEMQRGEVDGVFFVNANPAYTFGNQKEFSEALSKVRLKVSFSDRPDETAALCDVLAPVPNYLETWNDANPVAGYYTIVQPTINPVYNTRQAEQSLLIWSDNPVKNYYQYVKNNWERTILPSVGMSWKELLQKGVATTGGASIIANTGSTLQEGAGAAGTIAATSAPVASGARVGAVNIGAAAQNILKTSQALAQGAEKGAELSLYESVALRDGRYANNAWLQELPDPVSKVTWDNYVAINPKYAEKLGIVEFDNVIVKAGDKSIELPALYQPGQAQGTVSIALGYGRSKVGKAGDEVGKNAYPFITYTNGTFHRVASVTIEKGNGRYELAQTQTHHSFEGRNVVRETTFNQYANDPYSGTGKHEMEHKTYDLWPEHKQVGHSWVMAIDLNACTGCGACVVACNVENNIPVVGRDEVRRRREMTWLRIDRYYSIQDGKNSVTEENELKHLDNNDFEDVTVVNQPMLCQHCDHAPCETVCPVIATMHSTDGLNHMAYNRCVGTRYCANNCPYKVRRFNWFNYWNDSRFDNYMNNEFTQLVLNPDVTTRFRGVMEKCTMCIQRIQAGRLQAKIEKRPLRDLEIQTACQQTCPGNAIIFGDRNDPNSAVRKALDNERTYYVLQELNTQPGIGYQTLVRNTVEEA
ncbi:TAT-variant-translocated molybdopterin oxidoreductase [Pedobacter sp. SYSU D00535]|uniref:TAT-variant-translocated molybdopterin oxidoreductase n=1 Tax=Pedobacter sp. SYSU D00535 TaxID=2810308 RepID=UPI001A969F21|nr:TAT-variant-translocated molybdopterin oxidoreductase [Pedobacter sp. SYSU D00535]